MPSRRETDSVVDQPVAETEGELESTTPSSQSTTTAYGSEPTTEQIAQRAYEIYQARGGTEGQDVEDWLQAERELRRGFPGRD